MSYHAIDIIINEKGGISASHSENGQQGESIELSKEEGTMKIENEEVVDILNGILKENRLRGDDEYKMLGSLLYKSLLNNEIGRKILELRDHKQVEKVKIELQFPGNDNQVAHWPWEYLFCPPEIHGKNGGYFLSTEQKLILSRPVKTSIEELQEPVKVLLVAPGPSSDINEANDHEKIFGLALLAYKKLFEKIKGILENVELKKRFEVNELTAKLEKAEYNSEGIYRLTFKKFEETVKNIKPHIIHFFGHGRIHKDRKIGQVAFTDVNGIHDWIDENVFAKAIESANTSFVFLQACETAALAPYKAISGVARNLIDYKVPAVVAMQCKINQDSAIIFTESFYARLAENGIIEDAVQEGRQSIEKNKRKLFGSDDEEKDFAFGIPVLYVKNRKPLFIINGVNNISGSIKDNNITGIIGQAIQNIGLNIYCIGCKQLLPIDLKYCPNDCGEFVEKPVNNCQEAKCPQKLLKHHKRCGICNAVNTQYEPKK